MSKAARQKTGGRPPGTAGTGAVTAWLSRKNKFHFVEGGRTGPLVDFPIKEKSKKKRGWNYGDLIPKRRKDENG